MNALINEFLEKTNNDPHKAWDEYIKYHLMSGNSFPEDIKGIKDFIKASVPEQKKRRSNIKKIVQLKGYSMSIEQVVSYLKDIIPLMEEQLKMDIRSNNLSMARQTWSSLQSNKIMLCKITGKEYICLGHPGY